VDGRKPPAADRPVGLPDWFQTLGRGAWLLVGVAVLFVPLVDRLERWRLPRWLGAPVVVVLAIGVVALVLWIVLAQLLGREREILMQVTAGLDAAGTLAGVEGPDTDCCS
jgi:putative heme transporter